MARRSSGVLAAALCLGLLGCGGGAPASGGAGTGGSGAGGATGSAGAGGASPGTAGTDAGADLGSDAGADLGSDAGAEPEAPGGIDPGWVGFRRLSDVEYANTVAALLGVAVPAGRSFDLKSTNGPAAAPFDNLASAPPIVPPSYQAYFSSTLDLVDRAFADPTARARILTCAPSSPTDTACDQRIIRALGLRAWRRPLDAAEVGALEALAGTARQAGEDFAGAMKRVATALLASESFLHRVELDPVDGPARVHALTPYELASRLSYLLWSTMPDDTLFEVAATGALWRPQEIAAQAMRMLADPRADGFVRNFAGQWLGFRGLDAHVSDPAAAPGWSVALGTAMQEEARLYVSDFLEKDRDLGTFLTEDVNFVDDALAGIYGMPAPGAQGRLVRVEKTDDGRKGYLGLAAFLTATSRSASTSVSQRGAKVLNDLLCIDLGPTPKSGTISAATPRLQLEVLASQADCAGCHLQIDNVGLGLENFDGFGRFRTKYAPTDFLDIDPTGALPDGTPFRGLPELADLLQRDPSFLDCMSRKALVYTLGRPLAAADEPSLAKLRATWVASGSTLRGLLSAIVTSDIFRFRRGEPP